MDTCHLGIRVPLALKEKIETLASRDKRKVSDWLRIELESLVKRKGKTLFDTPRKRG